MVIPLVGEILFSDIDKELNRDVAITRTSLGESGNELLLSTAGTAVPASLLRGKGNFAGSQQWGGAVGGLFEFTVPDYRSMLVQVIGAGGGGGAGSTTSAGPTAVNGTNGGNAEFRTATPVVGLGGLGGLGGGLPGGSQNSVQPASSGTGGDTYAMLTLNATGSGYGEPGTTDVSGTGGRGGIGGQAYKIFTRGDPGAPIPGTIIPVFIGAAGKNGNPNLVGGTLDGFFYTRLYVGGLASVKVSWTARLLTSPQIYNAPGIWTFTVPIYTQMTMTVRGGTGGGGAARSINGSTSPTNGFAGGDSVFESATPVFSGGSGGGGGGGFGVNGQVGTAGVSSGPAGSVATGALSPGSGAAGPNGNGGPGGLSSARVMTFTRGAAGSPVPGTTIQVRIGAGGQSGDPDLGIPFDGKDGDVTIGW